MKPLTAANGPRRSLEDIIAETEKQRGVPILALESELLIQRVKDGGWSGDYLAQAFLSAIRQKPFTFSLGRLIHLDADGFRLFHQILHIRHVKGWKESVYIDVALSIEKILKQQER